MQYNDVTRQGYENLWLKAKVLPQRTVALAHIASKLYGSATRYQAVTVKTGVPWWWIACIHERESGSDFNTYLGNGEYVIGPTAMSRGRKTQLVPKGRGPFPDWEAGAIDALQEEELVGLTDWSLPHALYLAEKYNGFGYVGRINSPYIWSFTDLYSSGKFVETHGGSHFDARLQDQQAGVAAMLKAMLAEGFVPELETHNAAA